MNSTVLAVPERTKDIRQLAYDAAEHKNADAYVGLYLELFADDFDLHHMPRFYIRELKEAIKQTVPKQNQKALVSYFGLNGGKKHYLTYVKPNDLALKRMMEDACNASEYIESFKGLYMFQKETREIIDKVAAKVYDPEGKYTNVQKAEYAHIYYFFIKDFQLMPYDKEQGYRVLTDEQKNVEKKLFIVADMITDEYFKFFKDIPDGDILIPMIEEFLYNLDEEDEKFIRKFGQLDESRYFQAFMNEIRDVKEKIFNTGKWLNGDFMRLSTFQKLPENRVLDMLRIYEKYQESYEWKAQASKEKRVLFKNQGYQKIEYPQFIEGNTAFASESEMMQFLALMEFLKNEMPNMEFHKRSISECGFWK